MVAQNTAAAKKSASDASTSPVRRQPMRLMLQAQHAQPALSRTGRVVGSVSDFQRRNGITKATEASKSAAAAESSKSAALPVPVPRKRQKRMLQRHNNRSHFCIHRDYESVRSCHLSPDAAASKEAAKSSETNASSSAVAQLPRQQRQEIPRRRQKRRDERQVF